MLVRGSLLFALLLVRFFLDAQVTFFGEPEPVSFANTPQNELFLHVSSHGKLVITRELFAANVGGSTDPGDLWFEVGNALSNKLFPINEASIFASPIGYTPDDKAFLYLEALEKQGWEGRVMSFDLTRSVKAKLEIPELKNRSPRPSGCLSADGRFLILSLERPNGYGVEDLFVSRKNPDGTWSSPQGLGYRINTTMQEVSPFLAHDNRTLFFATNARQGFGGFDLYVTTRLDDTWRNWSEPQNLGPAVNSSGAEMSMVFNPNAEFAYFISTQNSDGYGDVKRIRIKAEIEKVTVDTLATPTPAEEVRYYLFKLLNARTKETIEGNVFYNGTQRVIEREGFSMEEGFSGQLEFKSEGYLSRLVTLPGNIETGKEVVLDLEPLETGNVITLKEVLFYRGTANFIEGSELELDLVVEMMNEHAEVFIFLKGHTDNVGDIGLNLQLSNERVMAVKNYLVGKGIVAGRIDGKGFGGSQPIADNTREETRQLNRRVEFEVIRK